MDILIVRRVFGQPEQNDFLQLLTGQLLINHSNELPSFSKKAEEREKKNVGKIIVAKPNNNEKRKQKTQMKENWFRQTRFILIDDPC